MRVSRVRRQGQRPDMEAPVGVLGDLLRRHRVPKGRPTSGNPHDQHGFMRRKSAWNSFDCASCGFRRGGGIPTFKALETSDQLVKWTHYEDVKRPWKKPLLNQQVETEGKLCDLWMEFNKHSKLYMAHHAKAKWQRDCHGVCLSTFKNGDIIIETGSIEKNIHTHPSVSTCARHLQTNFMERSCISARSYEWAAAGCT